MEGEREKQKYQSKRNILEFWRSDDLNLEHIDSGQIKKKKKAHTFTSVKTHGDIQCENLRKNQNHDSLNILFIRVTIVVDKAV